MLSVLTRPLEQRKRIDMYKGYVITRTCYLTKPSFLNLKILSKLFAMHENTKFLHEI